MYYAFYNFAIRLGSNPIENLPADISVPSGTKSFSNDHGQLSFHEHGTISDEPLVFGMYLIAMLISIALMVYVNLRYGKK